MAKLLQCPVTFLLFSLPVMGQKASLHGQVADESGAVVPGATVILNGPTGLVKTTTSANDGTYTFSDLPPGDYTVRTSAPGLALLEPERISLGTASQALNLLLNVASQKQEVTVEEKTGPAVSTDPSANASAVVIRGSDLDALSDNPDDLAADLEALAGPAAGPNRGAYRHVFATGALSSLYPGRRLL